MRRVLLVGTLCLMLLATQGLLAQSLEDRKAFKAQETANAKEFTGTIQAPIQTKAPNLPNSQTGEAAFGTITYDTGTFTNLAVQPAISGDVLSFGNQFNTQNGGIIPTPSVTVTQIAVWPALVDGSTTGSGSAFLTIFGPVNTAGTNAAPINSTNQGGLSPQTWNTVSQSGVIPFTGPAASFLIGMWASTAPATGSPCATDCVGFDDSASVNGQGFHGMHVDDFSGGDFGTISGENALIRAIGNVVPVELMTFEID